MNGVELNCTARPNACPSSRTLHCTHYPRPTTPHPRHSASSANSLNVLPRVPSNSDAYTGTAVSAPIGGSSCFPAYKFSPSFVCSMCGGGLNVLASAVGKFLKKNARGNVGCKSPSARCIMAITMARGKERLMVPAAWVRRAALSVCTMGGAKRARVHACYCLWQGFRVRAPTPPRRRPCGHEAPPPGASPRSARRPGTCPPRARVLPRSPECAKAARFLDDIRSARFCRCASAAKRVLN